MVLLCQIKKEEEFRRKDVKIRGYNLTNPLLPIHSFKSENVQTFSVRSQDSQIKQNLKIENIFGLGTQKIFLLFLG